MRPFPLKLRRCNTGGSCVVSIEGATWELVSNVSNYRVYDVFRFDEMLYVLANDAHLMPLYLLRSLMARRGRWRWPSHYSVFA
ncbi:MAG: hypothetical protein R3E31_23780 [Chloroflexota bacterium]